MTEPLPKQVKAPTQDQVAKALGSLSDGDADMALLKAALQLPNRQTVAKAIGTRPIDAKPLAPSAMAVVNPVDLSEGLIVAALAAMTQDQRVKVIMDATLAAGPNGKRY